MQKQTIEHGKTSTPELLESSFTLAGYLLDAQDEDAAILASMRVSADFLGAQGSAFIPLNEWKQTGQHLQHGEAEFLQDPDWQALLASPSTRHVCRNCQKKDAGSDCVLLRELPCTQNAYCVSLRCEGREIGIINYFFSSKPEISDDKHYFLEEMVRLTDLSLSALRTHAQEVKVSRRAFSPVDLKQKLTTLDDKNRYILDQLEYQAVLDERARIAREIHDGLAQTLAFLKIEAARMQEFISKGEMEKVPGMLKACYQTLSDGYLDARQAIDNLRQCPAESMGEWFETTAANFHDLTGMEVDVSRVRLTYEFPPNVKVQVVRIVQEALTNVRKHSQACSVSMAAYERDGEAVIEIRDNGRGFVSEEANSVSQYGLRSMRERAEFCGGRIPDRQRAVGRDYRPGPDSGQIRGGFLTGEIRIVVVDDHSLFLRGLVGLLSEMEGIKVVGEASDGRKAMDVIFELKPDVILLDVNMPDMDGIQTLVALRKKGVESAVLMLTISQQEQDLIGAIRAGANGYLLKNTEPEILRQTIMDVAAGKSVLAPEVTEQVFRVVRSGPVTFDNLLTDREVEVLQFLAKGLTTAQTAAKLFISENTVKTHIRHILEKLEVSNRAEAVARATQLGLI